MTASGLTIESPKIGQAITFLRTAKDTGGEELVIQARMRPGAFMPPHRHLHQEETFEVLEGAGTFMVSGRRIVARARRAGTDRCRHRAPVPEHVER